MQRSRFMLLTIGPAAIFLFFLLFAVLWSFYISFTDFSLVGRAARDPQFVGFKNYIKLFNDPTFYNSIKISFIFTIVSAFIGQAVLGLLLAIFLKQVNATIKVLVIVAVTLCWIMPDMVAVYVWGAFTSRSGLLNTILNWLKLSAVNWLGKMPLQTVTIANIWRGTAFSMMLFSSAIETIPPDYYEAAVVDGATSWQKFKSITLPLISPSILMDLILITMWTFGYFTLIYGLTGGGPGHLTEVFPVLIYNQAFSHYEIGYGAALSFIMMIIVGCLCGIYFILLRKAERMVY